MIINLNDNSKDNKILLISILGILDSLKYEVITIDEAEKFLFSPYIIGKLKYSNIDNRIIEVLEKCTELEDIKDLIPEKYNFIVNELKQEVIRLLCFLEENSNSKWVEIKE